MDHGQLRMVANKFQGVFAASLRNACGKDAQSCRRERIMTPFRLGLALPATCASPRVEPRADWSRGFHALFGTTVTSKAFAHQRATPHLADFARTRTARLSRDRTLTVLGVATGHACAALRPLGRQDRRSWALHDRGRAVFPGRFQAVQPAALARQTTLARLCDAPPPVVLPPDTPSAPACVPEPTSLRARVLLAERGAIDGHSLYRVQDEGGWLLSRAKAGRHPQILEALRAEGKRWRSLRHQSLQPLHAPRPTRQRVARRGPWHVEGAARCRRLRRSGHRWPTRCGACLPNLSAPRDPREVRWRADPWRGQVEGRWHAWTSDANLHAFDTANPALVEGRLWTAMAAAARKRFLAHIPHLLLEVPMSTRQVALWAVPA